MSCKTNLSKSAKFQPMPMAALLASIKALPAIRDSFGSNESVNSCEDFKNPVQECNQEQKENRPPVLNSAVDLSDPEPSSFPKPVNKSTRKEIKNEDIVKQPSQKETVKQPSQKETTKEISRDVVRGILQETPKQTHRLPPRDTPTLGPLVEVQEPSTSQTTLANVSAATPSHPQQHDMSRSNGKIQFKTVSIKGKTYMYLKKLGTGGSSQVFKVLELKTSNEFAVKYVNLGTDREMAQSYLNEVKVLRDLQKSDRVVKLYEYEYERSKNSLRLVLEVGETDLAVFLRAHRAGAPPALVLHYWDEMLRAVQQIHEHGIVHADLKPANFLLVSGRLKLIDFGIASAVSSEATSVVRSSGRGTFSYISPEALGGDSSLSFKVSFYSDVWSLGCILYSLVYGHTPFAHLSAMAKIAVIRDPSHSIAYPPVTNLPPRLISALKECLRYNGRSRPTVSDLLKIQYISQPSTKLPDDLLKKIYPHVTASEFSLLHSAMLPL